MPVASWVIVVWLSVLGAVLGSFFNVVVYRVPRGGSLIDPPSQCPKCKHPIRWRDNVPMLSWLLLRGRCRDCGIPISARYPIIEATCFLSFLTLAILECGLQGINLPAQSQSIESGMIVTLGWSGRELYALFLYHELLWCTLLVGALIEYDAHQVKWRVYVPALAIGIIAGIAAPVLHTVPVWGGVEGWFVGALNVAAGLAAGGLFGWLLSRWEPATRRNGVGLGLACTGLILGWQAVVGLAVATLLWQAAAAMVGRRLAIMRSVPTSLVLVGLTFVWLVAWAVVWAMLAPWLPGV